MTKNAPWNLSSDKPRGARRVSKSYRFGVVLNTAISADPLQRVCMSIQNVKQVVLKAVKRKKRTSSDTSVQLENSGYSLLAYYY